jgi:hypothetical protein
LGLLTEADGDTFGILCQVKSRLISVHKEIEAAHKSIDIIEAQNVGRGNETYKTVLKELPSLLRLERQYSNLFRVFAVEFGLTPRGRVGLQIMESGAAEGGELLT